MLVEDHAATFIVRASGHSMTGAGISDVDELLVDRSKRPQAGDIIVAVLDGELTVKRLELTPTGVVLRSENSEHPDIVVPDWDDSAARLFLEQLGAAVESYLRGCPTAPGEDPGVLEFRGLSSAQPRWT